VVSLLVVVALLEEAVEHLVEVVEHLVVDVAAQEEVHPESSSNLTDTLESSSPKAKNNYLLLAT
jgi:hypothetical protein